MTKSKSNDNAENNFAIKKPSNAYSAKPDASTSVTVNILGYKLFHCGEGFKLISNF